MIQDQVDAVDLNLGCPQGIAKKGFYGSFLQDEWDLIYNMISTLHVNLRIPVCAKMRIFKDRMKTLAYAKHICSAGVSVLTVHGRTREMKGQWTGLADWDVIREIRQVIPSDVVMFANGNIQFHGDVERCFAFTGVDGIMSAEGQLYNPAIFVDPNEEFEKRHPRIDLLAKEYLEIVRELDDPLSSIAVKAHLFKLFKAAFGVHSDIRNMLGEGKSFEDYEKIVEAMHERVEKEVEESSMTESGAVPWYRCQSYIRPDPGPMPVRKNRELQAEA
jgi:tRNA-dihydrouridine synthase 1